MKGINTDMREKIFEDIIDWFEGDTIQFIDKVLSDDILNPEYSAITCSNRITRLIQLENGIKKRYETIEDYLSFSGYSKEDIKIFMTKREKESKYYEGEIYEL